MKFLSFNKKDLERQKDLRDRITTWLKKPGNWIFTNTEDWFDGVFLDPEGKWIWTPPPCLARLAVEQLCEAKHIFPNYQHVFVCPALMTGYWQKMLGKVVDTMFTFKAGCCLWPESMYEPLTVAFVKPLLSSPPWKARHLPDVVRWEQLMSQMQWTSPRELRNHLRKFWC